MKKVYYFLFAALGLASCSNDENIEAFSNTANEKTEQIISKLQLDSKRRSYDEALEIAKNSISLLEYANPTTRGTETRTLNLATGVKVMCQPTTRGDGAVNDTVAYVFNFNNDNGFAIVSAKRSTEELLAVVENGNYDPNKKLDNEVVEEYLKNAIEYVANADDEVAEKVTRSISYSDAYQGRNVEQYRGQPVDMHVMDSVITSQKDIKKMIGVNWGKNDKFFKNNFGSVTSGHIVAALIMSGLGAPSNLYTINKPLTWVKINNFSNTNLTPRSDQQEGADQLKTIITESRKKVTNPSLAAFRSYMSAEKLKVGSIETYNVSYWHSDIVSSLEQGMLIFACGKNSKNVAQYFAIDGAYHYEGRLRVLLKDANNDEKWYVQNPCVAYLGSSLNHINWGEGEKYNGLFSINIFNKNANESNYNGTTDFSNNIQFFTVSK